MWTAPLHPQIRRQFVARIRVTIHHDIFVLPCSRGVRWELTLDAAKFVQLSVKYFHL